MSFIIAKTVTYVSSLTVTYVTTLYIVSSRAVSSNLIGNVGRIRTTSYMVPFIGTLRNHYLAGG